MTLWEPKPSASQGGQGAARRRPRIKKLLSWLRSVPIFAVILLAVPASHAQTADNPIPIRISAGESVTLERAAAKGDDVFELRATAGETLALAEDGYWPASAKLDPADVPGLRVIRADAKDSKALPKPEGFEDCADWRWMKVLPTSGVYHIVVSRRSAKGYRLRISLLDPHDPMFDPGITADRISIGTGLFALASKLTLKTFEPLTYMDYCTPLPADGGLPAHLCLENERAWLGIMSVRGLKNADPKWVEDGDLKVLQGVTSPIAVPLKPLFSVLDDAALAHWGRLEYFQAKSWRGLRWLAKYYQDYAPLQNPLMYVFAAISNDGKYFIWLRVDIDYLNPPPELFQLSEKQRAQFDDNQKAWETFQSKVNIGLNNASPKSFEPDLDRLDAFVRSIELH